MPLELMPPVVSRYLDSLVPDRPAELRRMEELAAQTDFPIIGPSAGQLCYLITRLAGARSVFELGSGFGYSTAWFARAVVENGGGVVHHTVWDDALSVRARRHLAALGFSDVVRFHAGEAVQALRASTETFDVIFNDIDKADYPASLPVIRDHLRPGGVLIVDNLLWSGRIFDDGDQSPATGGVRELTRLVMQDAGWSATIVPIRDGVLVARKQE
jgi:caffeoyl-CoA O-methyltransferase